MGDRQFFITQPSYEDQKEIHLMMAREHMKKCIEQQQQNKFDAFPYAVIEEQKRNANKQSWAKVVSVNEVEEIESEQPPLTASYLEEVRKQTLLYEKWKKETRDEWMSYMRCPIVKPSVDMSILGASYDHVATYKTLLARDGFVVRDIRRGVGCIELNLATPGFVNLMGKK